MLIFFSILTCTTIASEDCDKNLSFSKNALHRHSNFSNKINFSEKKINTVSSYVYELHLKQQCNKKCDVIGIALLDVKQGLYHIKYMTATLTIS